MLLFHCLGCKRIWTRCHDGSCPDFDCNCACEVIDGNAYTPAPTLPTQSTLHRDGIEPRPSLLDPVKNTAYSLTGGQQILKNRIQVNTADLSDDDGNIEHIQQQQQQQDTSREPISFSKNSNDIAISSRSEIDFSRLLDEDDSSFFIASLSRVYMRVSKPRIATSDRSEENWDSTLKPIVEAQADSLKPASPVPPALAAAPVESHEQSSKFILETALAPAINPTAANHDQQSQPENKVKRRKKKKNKSQVSESTSPSPAIPINIIATAVSTATATTATDPVPKSRPKKSKKKPKANSATAKTFKVDLPLPDFLQPPSQVSTTSTAAQTNTQLPIPFATAASLPSNNNTTATDSAWTTIPITSRLKRNKPAANASSHLSTQPGGAFGYRHEDVSQDSHIGVEYDTRGAKYLSRRVVPRL